MTLKLDLGSDGKSDGAFSLKNPLKSLDDSLKKEDAKDKPKDFETIVSQLLDSLKDKKCFTVLALPNIQIKNMEINKNIFEKLSKLTNLKKLTLALEPGIGMKDEKCEMIIRCLKKLEKLGFFKVIGSIPNIELFSAFENHANLKKLYILSSHYIPNKEQGDHKFIKSFKSLERLKVNFETHGNLDAEVLEAIASRRTLKYVWVGGYKFDILNTNISSQLKHLLAEEFDELGENSTFKFCIGGILGYLIMVDRIEKLVESG